MTILQPGFVRWDGSKFVTEDASVIGITGVRGPTGPQGPTGMRGQQGSPGAQGIPGVTGPQGNQGLQGSPGPTGPRGVTGTPGPTGSIGPQGPQGPAGSGGGSGAATGVGRPFQQSIYREGDSTNPPIYATFAEALDSLNFPGIIQQYGTIIIDDAFGFPTIVTGTYDLTGINLLGVRENFSNIVQLVIQDGTTFTNLPNRVSGVVLESRATSPVFNPPNPSSSFIILENGAGLNVDGGAGGTDFITIGAGANLAVVMESNSTIIGNGDGSEVIKCTGNGFCSIQMGESSFIPNGSLVGISTSSIICTAVSTSAGLPDPINRITVSITNNFTLAFTAQLTSGVSPLLPISVAGFNSSLSAPCPITVSLRTSSPGAGGLTRFYAALASDRVFTPGSASFKVRALLGDGTTNTLDNSLCDIILVIAGITP